MGVFIFATGIENSYPVVPASDGTRKRRDGMKLSGHYERWQEDFRLVQELGIRYLRYGPPYYSTHVAPGKYDWSFADETLSALRGLGIHPIVDLCHFGVPDWVGDFQNSDWPFHFAEYAKAFALRFPWVGMYTPINEIFIAATFSAQYGWWNEGLASDAAFVRALENLCRANVLAMRAVLEVRPNVVFIQSESSEYFHAEGPSCLELADFLNEKRFLALDLTYGRTVSAKMYEYLLGNGMSRESYHWFAQNTVNARCVMGNDYYVTNEHLVREDGTTAPSGEIFGYYVITHQYFDRYHIPVMHTETNLMDAERATGWLKKEWANVHRLRRDGVPILGFTWYSLVDQVDWDSALREFRGNVNPLGLYDLERRRRPVGDAYRNLISQWTSILDRETVSFWTEIS